jgi:sterol desaturase/sphingolipid hydroxylase (fatty acid hydroxylase superfamily)
MIFFKTARAFFYVNCYLFFVSFIVNKLNNCFISSLLRNISITLFIYYGTRNKQEIHTRQIADYKFKDYLYFFSSNCIQTATELLIKKYTKFQNEHFLYFLIRLFLFEIVLDFFHYTFHRIAHKFYIFHKTHHYYNHPTILNTFYHHPIDLILLESIPTMIGFSLVNFSEFEMEIVLVYKNFIEISGHSGKFVKSCCFPMCVWLPKLLGIDLYTHDHDRHHSIGGCNYSKRFSLWDKLFGTYKCC